MKTRFIILVCLLRVLFSGCAILDKPANSANDSFSADVVPDSFGSETEFIDAIKNGKANSLFSPGKLTYYYRSANVLPGYKLAEIELYTSYVMFSYCPESSQNNVGDQLYIKWFRNWKGLGDTYIADAQQRGKCKLVTLKNVKPLVKFFGRGTFSDEKAKGTNAREGAWICGWVQDDECFDASVPWSFNEDEIGSMLTMEKVLIQ